MLRIASVLPLMLALAACAPAVTVPERSILYEEPYDVAFAAVLEAAEAARLEDGVSLPVTETDAETGLVQLQGDPLNEGEQQTVTILVVTDAEGRSSVVVRSGSSGPSGTALAEEYALALIEEIDARLRRVER